MNTFWHKALRDLRNERARSVSIVVALAVGIAGFVAVLSSYPILTRALNDGYLATTPASATIAVDRLDGTAVERALATPGVQGAEARRTLRGRVKAGPAAWRNLVLFVRRDFSSSRIGTISPEHGEWPPGLDEVAIERDALQVARAAIGDEILVRTESGHEGTLRVSGSVHDVGQAQARMENLVYGYTNLQTLAVLGEEPYFDEIAIRVADRTLDEKHIRDVANAVAKAVEHGGARVVRIDVPEPGQHPHARIMGLLTLSIALFGFFILALSGTIVFNVLTALLAGQVRQIGVMKALGGTRTRIASVYLLEAGLLGVAAVLLALPIGIAGGRWLCRWQAVFLNFDIESYAVPVWVYAVTLVVAVGVPIVAALLPAWFGTRVPVRDALQSNALIGRPYGTSLVDRALGRIGGRSRVILLATRNVTRNPLRVALTTVTLAVAGIFFMSALNVRDSIITSIDRYYEARRADLSIQLAGAYPIDAVEHAARTPQVAAAEGWVIVDGATPAGDAAERPFAVAGIPVGSRFASFDLAEGRTLGDDARDVVVNTALFTRLGGPPLGSDVRLRIDEDDAALHVVGVSREPFTPATAYISRSWFDQSARAGTANALRIQFEVSATSSVTDSARAAIDASLDRAGIRTLQSATKNETRYSIDQHMLMVYVFLIAMSCILGVVGALGMLTTVSLNVTERRREIGVLRAIGATPARVSLIMVLEAIAVAVASWLIAVVAAGPVSGFVADFLFRRTMGLLKTEIVVSIEPDGIAIWLLVAIVGSCVASFLPARQASRAPVREALSYE